MTMNEYAVLIEGFEHLSYPLGRSEAADRKAFSERRENFILHRAESRLHAEMLVGSSDWLSEHSAQPVGFVGDEKGEVFVVCRAGAKAPDGSEAERKGFCLAVMHRLASLHSQGFGCGGLSPEAVDYSGKEARLIDPSRIFALSEGDSLFYEAVSTLRALAGSGLARKEELESLAYAYVSFSPVCRHGVASHLSKKGVRHGLHRELAEHARRLLPYF